LTNIDSEKQSDESKKPEGELDRFEFLNIDSEKQSDESKKLEGFNNSIV